MAILEYKKKSLFNAPIFGLEDSEFRLPSLPDVSNNIGTSQSASAVIPKATTTSTPPIVPQPKENWLSNPYNVSTGIGGALTVAQMLMANKANKDVANMTVDNYHPEMVNPDLLEYDASARKAEAKSRSSSVFNTMRDFSRRYGTTNNSAEIMGKMLENERSTSAQIEAEKEKVANANAQIKNNASQINTNAKNSANAQNTQNQFALTQLQSKLKSQTIAGTMQQVSSFANMVPANMLNKKNYEQMNERNSLINKYYEEKIKFAQYD